MAKHLSILIVSSCIAFLGACGLDTEPSSLVSQPAGPGVGGAAAPASGAQPGKVARPDETAEDAEPESEDDMSIEVDPDDSSGDDSSGDDSSGGDQASGDDGADTTCEAMSCDDDNPCTRDRQTMRGGKCACSHTAIVRMRDGDQCCPPGAGPGDDADCEAAAACGNGRVDAGEQCDGGEACRKDCTSLFASSLVHRYSFEGDGDQVVDSVGDADGRVVNGRLSGDGALVLPGAVVYAELPRGLISSLTSATIEFWITTVGGGGGQRVFDFGDDSLGSGGTSYWAMTPLSIIDGNAMTIVNVTPEFDSFGQGDQYVSGPSPVQPGRVHHFAVVFDDEARTLSLYMEGRLQDALRGLDGQLSDIDDSNCWLGRGQSDIYPFLNGRIHEFRIYDKALTAAEITQSFAAGQDPK